MTLIFGEDDEQSIWTNHLFHLICHTFMMKFIPKNSPVQYGMVITTFDDDDNDGKHLGALIRYKDPETNEMVPYVTIIQDAEHDMVRILLPMFNDDAMIVVKKSDDVDDDSIDGITVETVGKDGLTDEQKDAMTYLFGIVASLLKDIFDHL